MTPHCPASLLAEPQVQKDSDCDEPYGCPEASGLKGTHCRTGLHLHVLFSAAPILIQFNGLRKRSLSIDHINDSASLAFPAPLAMQRTVVCTPSSLPCRKHAHRHIGIAAYIPVCLPPPGMASRNRKVRHRRQSHLPELNRLDERTAVFASHRAHCSMGERELTLADATALCLHRPHRFGVMLHCIYKVAA